MGLKSMLKPMNCHFLMGISENNDCQIASFKYSIHFTHNQVDGIQQIYYKLRWHIHRHRF